MPSQVQSFSKTFSLQHRNHHEQEVRPTCDAQTPCNARPRRRPVRMILHARDNAIVLCQFHYGGRACGEPASLYMYHGAPATMWRGSDFLALLSCSAAFRFDNCPYRTIEIHSPWVFSAQFPSEDSTSSHHVRPYHPRTPQEREEVRRLRHG